MANLTAIVIGFSSLSCDETDELLFDLDKLLNIAVMIVLTLYHKIDSADSLFLINDDDKRNQIKSSFMVVFVVF